jgi:hypothetical protein
MFILHLKYINVVKNINTNIYVTLKIYKCRKNVNMNIYVALKIHVENVSMTVYIALKIYKFCLKYKYEHLYCIYYV